MAFLEFFTGFITLIDNPVWDWIVGALLVSICAGVAYWIGGYFNYHGKFGFVMWLLTAIVLYALIACLIRFVMWLFFIPWWVWVIIGVVFIAVLITVISMRSRKRRADDLEEPVDDG